MIDFLKKYQNKKFVKNTYFIVWAFVVAFALNLLIFESMNFWQNLKTSVLDSQNTLEQQTEDKKSDIYIEEQNWKLFLKNSKEISDLQSISFSLVYDNSSIENLEVNSTIWETQIIWEKWSGIETVIINANVENIEKNSILAEIKIQKKENIAFTAINLTNANFIDKQENIFNLTTSGISL